MASDPGFIDVLGGEEAFEELPYPQEYDYLWTEERNSLQEGNGILDPSLWFQGAADRQGIAGTNPLAVALVVGIAYSGLLLANSLLNPPPKPKLENDDMCGITTGGQDECWWDCMIISERAVQGQAITNPECMRDCFSDTSGTGRRRGGKRRQHRRKKKRQMSEEEDSSCFALLIEDVTSKGTCDDGENPAKELNIWGFNELGNDCGMVPRPQTSSEGFGDYGTQGSDSGSGDYGGDYSGDYGGDYSGDYSRDYSGDYGGDYSGDYSGDYTGDDTGDFVDPAGFKDIINGTCSKETEELLKTASCLRFLAEQPSVVRNTLEQLVKYSCSNETFKSLPFSGDQTGGLLTKRKNLKPKRARLSPVTEVNVTANFRTQLNFNNTRHRYPWICSLRTRGVNSEHLCAVNLLAVPPNPTVIVGSAHCTYMCKDTDSNGVMLPACCCVTNKEGQESCSADTVKCGTDPKAVEMDGSDAEIICGEWQTGSTSRSASGEQYNVVLPIVEIIQSPAFDADGKGPGGGSDIAVFKVNDASLQNPRKLKIYPACLPPKDRNPPTEGVHSGWSKPPPLHFLERYGPGFIPFYSDFFKQWHYKMKIQASCHDPNVTQFFGLDVQYPSNTYYPPATVCAIDVTAQSCFSTGDSGSPLMVREDKRPQRYFIEGILSFVKGCEQLVFGARNDAGTRFDLLQNSENPAAYAKLSCHLPWVADQYGLSYDGVPDESCSQGTGPTVPFNATHEYDAVCRRTRGTDIRSREDPCIFPFYYRGKGPYHQCMLFEEDDFVYPVFRCPTRNITTKFPGTNINHYEDTLELTSGICYDIELAAATCDETQENPGCIKQLDPSITNCGSLLEFPPFSTCKNDCPGGKKS